MKPRSEAKRNALHTSVHSPPKSLSLGSIISDLDDWEAEQEKQKRAEEKKKRKEERKKKAEEETAAGPPLGVSARRVRRVSLQLPHSMREHHQELAAEDQPVEEGAPPVAPRVHDGEAVVPRLAEQHDEIAHSFDLA